MSDPSCLPKKNPVEHEQKYLIISVPIFEISFSKFHLPVLAFGSIFSSIGFTTLAGLLLLVVEVVLVFDVDADPILIECVPFCLMTLELLCTIIPEFTCWIYVIVVIVVIV